MPGQVLQPQRWPLRAAKDLCVTSLGCCDFPLVASESSPSFTLATRRCGVEQPCEGFGPVGNLISCVGHPAAQSPVHAAGAPTDTTLLVPVHCPSIPKTRCFQHLALRLQDKFGRAVSSLRSASSKVRPYCQPRPGRRRNFVAPLTVAHSPVPHSIPRRGNPCRQRVDGTESQKMWMRMGEDHILCPLHLLAQVVELGLA